MNNKQRTYSSNILCVLSRPCPSPHLWEKYHYEKESNSDIMVKSYLGRHGECHLPDPLLSVAAPFENRQDHSQQYPARPVE